jgi:hypothetical protein
MKENKEPSLFRQIIAIHYEQAKRHRALRILEKQHWSVDFLSTLLLKSAKMLGTSLQLTIVSPDNVKLVITAKDLKTDDGRIDDSDIFNHLDDESAVNDFIAKHSTR